jgi:hypothetical protein
MPRRPAAATCHGVARKGEGGSFSDGGQRGRSLRAKEGTFSFELLEAASVKHLLTSQKVLLKLVAPVHKKTFIL